MARIALPRSISPLAPRIRRTTVACTLLASVAVSAAGCSARDADAARRDVHTTDTVAAAPIAHAPVTGNATSAAAAAGGARGAMPASEGRSTSGVVSRTVAATTADTLLASADVYAGWRNFNVNCQSCHGFNAVASEAAPDLRNSVRQGGTLTRSQFHEVVRKGRMAKGMPAWGALLDAKQIDQIYAYLLARSTGALGAGRPNVGGE
jgi:mono/diheme cytochrome c family protein